MSLQKPASCLMQAKQLAHAACCSHEITLARLYCAVLWFVMLRLLCCACCAVLCCAVLCCAVLGRAVLFCRVLCAVLRFSY
jgi:hypothetical protein